MALRSYIDHRLEGIDAAAAARGASTGFSILLVGGLLAPIVALWLPALGTIWLTLTAVVAFTVAGIQIGSASSPALQGAIAAISAYLLILPLVLLGGAAPDPVQIALTLGAAVVMGSLTGWLRRRWRCP